MISSRPTIPLLVHEDCMDAIKTDLAGQQASLSNISTNTQGMKNTLERVDDRIVDLNEDVMHIGTNTNFIRDYSTQTAIAVSSIDSSVGTTTDASTENTVIGLLKSIANKL